MAKSPKRFDPTPLRVASKLIDTDGVPPIVVLPPTTLQRPAVEGRLWHDRAASGEVTRDFGPLDMDFAPVLARRVEYPFLAKEMVLFDEERLYLDTSIQLAYSPVEGLPEVIERFTQAITDSAGDRIDDRFRHETILVAHHEGGMTWGHYLIQSLPRILVFLEAFPAGKIAMPASILDGDDGFTAALNHFAIPKDRLIPVESDRVYRFRAAILLDFPYDFERAMPYPTVLESLYGPNAAVEDRSERSPAPAFIERAPWAARAIANPTAVQRVLSRYGARTYRQTDLGFAEQINLWRRHDLFIATLGSDLANIVFAPPGATLLVLAPDWFGDAFFFQLALAKGLRWYELRCGRMVKRADEERNSSFRVDPALLDEILSGLARPA